MAALANGPRYPLRGLAAAVATALVGPLLGALIFVAALVVGLVAGQQAGDPNAWRVVLAFTGLAMLYSYLFGGLPALVAGLWYGVLIWRYGRVSYWVAVLVGAMSGLVLTVPFVVSRSDNTVWYVILISGLGAIVAPILIAVFAMVGITVRPTAPPEATE